MRGDRSAEKPRVPIDQAEIQESERNRYVTFSPLQFRQLLERGYELLAAHEAQPSFSIGMSIGGRIVRINPDLEDRTPLRPNIPTFKDPDDFNGSEEIKLEPNR